MDKDKFIKWLSEKTNCIIINTTDNELENKESKAYLQGSVTVMEEIKAQVESGKFDK